MKLKKLSLNNFGRFRGEVLKLEDGINVIYGENESGKSTVHTFIRSMLFGMKRGRGRRGMMCTAAMNPGKMLPGIRGGWNLPAEGRNSG